MMIERVDDEAGSKVVVKKCFNQKLETFFTFAADYYSYG